MAVAILKPFRRGNDLLMRGRIGPGGVSVFYPWRSGNTMLWRGKDCQGNVVYGYPFRQGDNLLARAIYRDCAPPTGYCCVPGVGCTPGYTEQQCDDAGGTWHETLAACQLVCPEVQSPPVPVPVCTYPAGTIRCRYAVIGQGWSGNDCFCVPNYAPGGIQHYSPGWNRFNRSTTVYHHQPLGGSHAWKSHDPRVTDLVTCAHSIPATPASGFWVYAELQLTCPNLWRLVTVQLRHTGAFGTCSFGSSILKASNTGPVGLVWTAAELTGGLDCGTNCGSGSIDPNCVSGNTKGSITIGHIA